MATVLGEHGVLYQGIASGVNRAALTASVLVVGKNGVFDR